MNEGERMNGKTSFIFYFVESSFNFINSVFVFCRDERRPPYHELTAERHTMRMCVPQVPTQRIHVENILPEVESFIQNGILIREIIMTHDAMMTPVNTGIIETHMSRIFGSTSTYKESVKGKESDLKRIVNETTVDDN